MNSFFFRVESAEKVIPLILVLFEIIKSNLTRYYSWKSRYVWFFYEKKLKNGWSQGFTIWTLFRWIKTTTNVVFPKTKLGGIAGPEAYHKTYVQRRRLRRNSLSNEDSRLICFYQPKKSSLFFTFNLQTSLAFFLYYENQERAKKTEKIPLDCLLDAKKAQIWRAIL